MRRPARADLVVWLSLAIITVLVVAVLLPDATRAEIVGAVHPRPPALAPLLVAAAAALGVLLLARRPDESWPAMQIVAGLGGSVWTAALVLAREPVFDGREVGSFFGNGLSDLLARMPGMLPGVMLGLGGGLAVLLVNAAVRSLSGEVQARRLMPAVALSPGLGFVADGMAVGGVVAVCGVLALSALASERGRGLLSSTVLGLLSGVLLVVGALAGFAASAAGVGLLCIYFLRRRSLMIFVAGLGVLVSLLSAAAIGWSWPAEFGAASALRLADPAGLAAGVVVATLAVSVIGGPVHRASWRKLRGTPAWPVMLTGLVAAVVDVLTRPAALGTVPAAVMWLPLLVVAASAPPRSAGTPDGPEPVAVLLTALCGVAVATLPLG